ncbi:hypothetical protein [Streptomyces sp. NPDC093094]|uniref:hypothetical protein n=1 Tax=Streptomyces sp. NPDC093094 TaxID=3366026 RepID=UPI003827A392
MAAGKVDSVQEAAEKVGVTVSQVYGYARRDEEFRTALDEAAETLCIDPGGVRCGRAYRAGCRGTTCRLAHTPTTRRGVGRA